MAEVCLKNQCMKVQVPVSVDVNKILAPLNLTQAKHKNLKHKIYYFLSRIVTHNENYHLFQLTNGYVKISSVHMKSILGNKYYYQIIDLLSNPIDQVIESDDSWYNPKSKDLKGYCKGYKLTEKYNTGEVEFKTISEGFDKKNNSGKNIEPTKLEGSFHETVDKSEIENRYDFLYKQFERHQLSIDSRVYEYIRKFGNQLLHRVKDNNPFQIKIILNTIGRWLYQIHKINTGQLWCQVSKDNHRLNSNITGLRKVLRPFIKCNGKPMVEVDITSSQPYILSSMLNDKFFLETTDGYNLHTIYPELYNEMNCSKSNYTDNTFNYFSTKSGNTNYSFSSVSGSCSFMWCKFYTHEEQKSIIRYQQSSFNTDFYKETIKMYYTKLKKHVPSDLSSIRDELKKSMMFVLFDDNMNHRYNNSNIRLFKSTYPGIDKWICEMHHRIGKERFAYLLQRTESYLLLNSVCRDFNKKFPMAPVFTIHDSILTYPEYSPDLTSLVLKRMEEITGVSVGVKNKLHQIDPEPTKKDIDDEWSKIEKVNTQKKYENKSGGVFNSNIERGFEFLNFLPKILKHA
jgi:hypothetical protein